MVLSRNVTSTMLLLLAWLHLAACRHPIHMSNAVTDVYQMPSNGSWVYSLTPRDGKAGDKYVEWLLASIQSLMESNTHMNITIFIDGDESKHAQVWLCTRVARATRIQTTPPTACNTAAAPTRHCALCQPVP